jgi:DNA-binding response OmpR family regulator
MLKKILVVDDEQSFQQMVQELLENNGYQVIAALDAWNGFEKAKSEKPDLIILDINMPKASGCALNAILENNSETKYIPIIFLTGYIDSEEVERVGKKLAGHVLLTKPFNNQELLQKIEELISRSNG